MMSSFISQDSELGTQHVAGSDSSVSTTSGPFRPFSPARVLFCLLTAFDFLAALFIWILHVHVSSWWLTSSVKDLAIYKILLVPWQGTHQRSYAYKCVHYSYSFIQRKSIVRFCNQWCNWLWMYLYNSLLVMIIAFSSWVWFSSHIGHLLK